MKLKIGNFVTQNNKNLHEEYKILDLIGEGSFGEVRIAKHKRSKEIRAIKMIKKDSMTSNYKS